MRFNRINLKIKGLNIDSSFDKIYKNVKEISNIKRESHDEIEFTINASDYDNIKKYLTNLDVERKHIGISTIKQLLYKYLAVILAIPFIFSMFIFNNKYINDIEILGINHLSKAEVVCILEDNNIEQGSKIKYNTKEIENILIKSIEVAQVSCFYRGTTLIINITEKLVYNPTKFEPIVAKYNGIIQNYKLYRGTINVKIGEFVHVGDILVYPYILDKNGTQVTVEPKADIIGKFYVSHTQILPHKEIILVESGKTKTKSKLYFRTAPKHVKHDKPFVFFTAIVYNDYISDILPFIRQKIVYKELVEKVKTNDLIAMQKVNEQTAKDKVQVLIPNSCEIQEYEINSLVIDNILYSSAMYICLGDII